MEGFEKYMALALVAIPAIASAISAAFPDAKLGRIAGLINALALNFKNAKNDPAQAEE